MIDDVSDTLAAAQRVIAAATAMATAATAFQLLKAGNPVAERLADAIGHPTPDALKSLQAAVAGARDISRDNARFRHTAG
jgi:hypothetical protein